VPVKYNILYTFFVYEIPKLLYAIKDKNKFFDKPILLLSIYNTFNIGGENMAPQKKKILLKYI